jgi:hypothetical protein
MQNEFKNTFIKQPYERLPIDVNFGSLTILPKGATKIVAASATAKKWKRMDPENIQDATAEFLVSATPTILASTKRKVRVDVTGGVDGFDYQVTVRVEFDNGAKLEEELFIRVTER